MLEQPRAAIKGLFSLISANLRPENFRFRFQNASRTLISDTRISKDPMLPLTISSKCIAHQDPNTKLWDVQFQVDISGWRHERHRREIIGRGLDQRGVLSLFRERINLLSEKTKPGVPDTTHILEAGDKPLLFHNGLNSYQIEIEPTSSPDYYKKHLAVPQVAAGT